MNKELRYLLLGLVLGAGLAGGLAWLLREPGAHSFDECVLENIKAGMGDHASALVVLSCRNLFPAVPPPSAPAPAGSVHRVRRGDTSATRAPLEITLDFTQECWVELVVDDRRRLSELHAPGESLQIEAERTVLLANVGNPQGVEVQVNGEPFPLPAEGRVVRDVRIELAPPGS